MLFKQEDASPDDPKTVFCNKGDVTASTNDGGVIFQCCDDTSGYENDGKSERLSSCVELTEYILRPLEQNDEGPEKEGSGDQIQDNVPMRRSLFPFVAPYVMFHSINCTCPKLSSSISKYLKWKLSGVTPRIVIRTLRKSGYRLVTDADDWSGIWGHSVKDASIFKNVKCFQKLNCFPGSHNLGCKDELWRNFSRLRRVFGKEEFGFVPETFILPRDIGRLKEAWRMNLGERWIVKPTSSGRGQGIRVIDQWWEVPKWHLVVIQRYLTRPKLINGRKFDLRVYVLATSIDPLRVYVYSEGLVRFASVKYVDNSKNLNDRFMHLTNTSINKYSPNYVVNGNASSSYGHKWSFGTLWDYLATVDNVDVKALWGRIKDIVVKTLIGGEASMCAKIRENVPSTYACYELYGFDVILDEDFKPWLLEVNTLPSLHTDSPLDVAVKAPLIRDVLNMAGYQLPANMTVFEERQLVKEFQCPRMRQDERIYSTSLGEREKRKQSEFLRSTERANYIFAIIRDLTRDDVRQLIRYEDEITQIGNFEKVFPTSESHKYHRFFKTQRYYNLLFDAWEFQASKDRREGIERLKNLCRKKFHLETMTAHV